MSADRLPADPAALQVVLELATDDLLCEVAVLKVECNLAGATTVNGVLSVANFTVTSASARKTRAKDLRSLADADEISFDSILEELCQQVICAEDRGKPLVLLRNIEDTPDDD